MYLVLELTPHTGGSRPTSLQSTQLKNAMNQRSLLVRKEAKPPHILKLPGKRNLLTWHWLSLNLQAKLPTSCNYKYLNYTAGIDPLRCGTRAMCWPHYSFSPNSWGLTTTENQCLGKLSGFFFSPPVIIQFSSYKAEANSLPDCIWVFRDLLPYCFRK